MTQKETLEAIIGEASAFTEFDPKTDAAFVRIRDLARSLLAAPPPPEAARTAREAVGHSRQVSSMPDTRASDAARLAEVFGFIDDLLTSNPNIIGRNTLQDYARFNRAMMAFEEWKRLRAPASAAPEPGGEKRNP